MKKLIFLLPLIFTLSASSQTEKPITKGNMILSGGGTINYSKVKLSNSTQPIFEISVNPGIGYFFVNNLAIGLITDFSYYTNMDYNKNYSIGIGPTVKYYFGNGILIKGESTYGGLRGLGDSSFKSNTFTFKPGLGYAFFINSKVSLEPSLNYKYTSYTSEDEGNTYGAKSNNLQIELNIVIFL
jgi:hypothetical protein